eukprot:gene4238-7575_t
MSKNCLRLTCFLLCLLNITWTQEFKGFQCRTKGNTYILSNVYRTSMDITVRTNAPLGYSLVVLSPSKKNFKNSVFIAFEGGSTGKKPRYQIYSGNTTYVPTGIWYNMTKFGKQSLRLAFNDFTIAKTKPTYIPNDFYWSFSFNRTKLLEDLPVNQSFKYAFVGSNYYASIPTNSPYSLPPPDQMEVMPFDIFSKDSFCFIPSILRWSTFHWSLYAIEMSFYVIILIICTILYIFKFQPLYSRGLTPIIGSISQIFLLLSQIHFFALNVEGISNNFCLFDMFFYYPGVQMSLILIPIHLIRYIAIINLARSKKTLYITKNNGKKEVGTFLIKMLKIIQNPFINLFIVLLYLFFYLSIEVIIYFVPNAIGKGGYCVEAAFYNSLFSTIFVCIWIGLWVIGLCLDTFLYYFNFIKFKSKGCNCTFKLRDCNPYSFFVKKDPFTYRIELYILGPILVCAFLFYILFALLGFDQQYRLIFIIFSSLFNHLVFIYQVLFVLILTIIQIIRQLICRSQQPKEEIDRILFDRENGGFEMFSNFAQDEYSIENVSCWEDIQKYKKSAKEKDQQKMREIATEMYSKYLNGAESPFEVNVSSKCRKNVKEKLKEENDLEDNLFDETLAGVKLNLSDTYSRIHVTTEFALYSQRTRFKQEMGLDNQNIITKTLNRKSTKSRHSKK